MSALKRVAPMLNDGVKAMVIMGLGDVVAQTLVDKKPVADIDWKRTGKFAGIGLLYVGPALHLWYGYLNRAVSVNQPTLQRGLKKMAIDQIAFAPIFTFVMIPIFCVLNGENNDKIKERLNNDFVPIMKRNYMLWPAAQTINFAFVPIQYQVLYQQIVAVFWNTYLSAVLNAESQKKATK